MNITVVGLGYVGIANALLLAQNHSVTGVDIDENKIKLLSKKESPLQDPDVEEYLMKSTVDWSISLNSIANSELLIVATPTDYNEKTGSFNTSSIEKVIEQALVINPEIHILIKSTIPIGYVLSLRLKFNTDKIAFSPEFLREGKALYDNLYPSRIIIGEKSSWAQSIAKLFSEASLNDPEIILTGASEAESIKLFSNSYLAMRVAYFNELDTFCIENSLNASDVVLGTSLDPRIGNYYNNPSFGYGGYCLPKDTKQLQASYGTTPNEIISSITRSNEARKRYLAEDILNKNPRTVGIYKLAMKAGSDNFRMSAIMDIIKLLEQSGVKILIYEPELKQDMYEKYTISNDFNYFAEKTDLILANRIDPMLSPYISKVYTRDIFHNN
jgi:UDPglucose 6-dehydrogenase